jgi:hypothetical protein
MTDIQDVVSQAQDKVDQAKAAVAPTVATAVTWRDRYLNFVSAHPKAVSIVLAVAVVLAILGMVRV